MKKYLFPMLLAAFFAIGFVASDEDENTVIDDTEKPTEPDTPINKVDSVNVGVDINIDNPLAICLTSIEGDTIYFYAHKDEEGYPTSLIEMDFAMSDGSSGNFYFNDDGKPTFMEGPDGTKFEVEWVSETLAAVTIVDPTTGDQVNTYVDLNGDISIDESSSRKVDNDTTEIVIRDGEISLDIKPISLFEEKSKLLAPKKSEISSSTIPAKITLKQCEELVDGTCYIDVYEQGVDGKFVTKCRGTKVSKGVYIAQIPKSIFSEADNKEYFGAGKGCDGIVNFMHGVCEAKGYFESASDILAGLGILSKKLPGWVGVAIAAIQPIINKYCNTLDPRLSDIVCEKIKDLKQKSILYNASHVKLIPYVLAMPYNIYGYPINVDLANPISDMEVSWGGTPSITSFTLNPSAPMHGVGYDATAVLYCIPAGSTIYMDIKGTDGYSNSKTESISSSTSNYTATLHVPGAKYSGVEDVCNVVVTTPEGKNFKKTASLVFK